MCKIIVFSEGGLKATSPGEPLPKRKMIISASRYTDIPAYYSDWFFNRVRMGNFFVRSKNTQTLINRIPFTPETVEGIVFWTKNPAPMLDRLDLLKEYPYYFQFTVNPYRTDIERYIPKKSCVIDTFKRLSEKIGSNRVVWRYAPIFISENLGYTLEYHEEWFDKLATILKDYTTQCILSLINIPNYLNRYINDTDIRALTSQEIASLAEVFSKSARKKSLKLSSCGNIYGIEQGRCIDSKLLSQIGNSNLLETKDPSRAEICRCVNSIDIGDYNTCQGGCIYCTGNPQGFTNKDLSLFDNKSFPLLLDIPRFNDTTIDINLKDFSMKDNRKHKKRTSYVNNNIENKCNQISFDF